MIDEVIEYLRTDTGVKSVVLFFDNGKQGLTKVVITVTRVAPTLFGQSRNSYKVTEGPLNHAESEYVLSYKNEYGDCPSEWIRLKPKRRK